MPSCFDIMYIKICLIQYIIICTNIEARTTYTVGALSLFFLWSRNYLHCRRTVPVFLMKQELLTLSEHCPCFSYEVGTTYTVGALSLFFVFFSFQCCDLWTVICLFLLFLLAIVVLSVLRITVFDYLFMILSNFVYYLP